MATQRQFEPKLHILPQPQRNLWPELGQVPHEFTLYGGTAIALQLAHRDSVDFDFFGSASFDPDRLQKAIPFLADAEIVQRQADTLTARLSRGGAVKISFFATPQLGRVQPPLVAADTGVRVAALIDLAGMKADVVQKRAEAKDYVDIDALMRAGISLAEALSAARAIQGPFFNPQITLKALSYYGEGDLGGLPSEVKQRIQDAVRTVDVENLPAVNVERRARGEP